MRFGESFPQGADPKNRMDVLKLNKEQEDIPSYIRFGLEIRNNLKSKIEKDGWPDLPNQEDINLTEDIFEAAKSEVNKTWENSVQTLINEKTESWKQDLSPDNPENKAVLDLLNNPGELSKSFSLRQFGVLEILRTANPDAWRTLVVASSERQLASIAVMEHWLKNGNPENLQAMCNKINLNPAELKLFVDTAAILGKYVDHAYVKQIELADSPGGSEATKLKDEDGAAYLYDLYKDPRSEDIYVKTYSDIFPYEWEKIQSRLEMLSVRTKLAIDKGELPDSYNLFANYLEKTGQVYGSKSIQPEALEKEWDSLYKMGKEVDNTSCPLMIIPQGCASVSGEAGKVDAEIRLGLKTKETKEQERGFSKFTGIAQEMINENRDCLAKDYKVPDVKLNYQPWSFGPNLYWITRGESGEDQILSHTNAVREVAITNELPLLKKIFKKDISNQEYSRAAVTETVLHEVSHNVLDSEDKKVSKRIGKSFEVGILDELKAETLSMKILYEAHNRNELPNGVDIKTQLLAKLGANLDYLKNKSNQKASAGEPYYICSATIFSSLMEKGLLVNKGSGYEINNPEACIKEIASLSENILSFYTNTETRPADVKNYINELRRRSQSPIVQELIKKL
ncbi:MAG: hypothetical protein HY931_04325 [Candidatus Falkowbacteria bacterium]|nr:MAG: hypothetical protein HY931_04325 [Candidatus Falkowbacteria bacterium]